MPIPIILRSHFLDLLTKRIIQYEKFVLHKNEVYEFTYEQTRGWVDSYLKKNLNLYQLLVERWLYRRRGKYDKFISFVTKQLIKDCKNFQNTNIPLNTYWETHGRGGQYNTAIRARWGGLL